MIEIEIGTDLAQFTKEQLRDWLDTHPEEADNENGWSDKAIQVNRYITLMIGGFVFDKAPVQERLNLTYRYSQDNGSWSLKSRRQTA